MNIGKTMFAFKKKMSKPERTRTLLRARLTVVAAGYEQCQSGISPGPWN